jgi:hypothetical protein
MFDKIKKLMKKLLVLFGVLFFISCEDEAVVLESIVETDIPNPVEVIDLNPLAIQQIIFEAELNSTLEEDVVLEFDGKNTFSGLAPLEADINNLIPSFDIEDAEGVVYMDNEIVESGLTVKDFSKEVVVKTESADETASSVYLVRLAFDSGLPALYINVEGGQEIEYSDVKNKFYYDANLSLYGGLDFDDIESTDMKIRGRGNSTWYYGSNLGKKPYQIEFLEQQEVLGMPSDRRWVLLAENSDKSLIRNKIAFYISSLSHLEYTPKGKYVDLYFNGSPMGTYLLAQKAEVTNNRLDIGPTGYLLEITQGGRLKDSDVRYESSRMKDMIGWAANDLVFTIKYPLIQSGGTEYQEIKNHIDAFEAALFSSDFKDPEVGYRSYIDVASFVDWYVIQEIAKSVDAKWYSSIFLNYVPGKKIKMGPLWDFDLSFGNCAYPEWNFYDSYEIEGYHIKRNPWWDRLFQDPYFVSQVKNRFQYFKNRMPEILSKIDEYGKLLDVSQQKNYELWGTLGQWFWPNPIWFDTYQEEVDHLKQWMTERVNWLDSDL